MIPYDYQEKLSNVGLDILRKNAIVYLAMEERTGKTLTAVLIAEKSAAMRVLVITKKTALDGWHETMREFTHEKQYTIINYHQAHKLGGEKWDLVILDESHNYISAFPKAGLIWRQLAPMLKDKPLIYMSATPYAQGPQMLFHQFALSSWSPWKKHKNFYQWFRQYGFLYDLKINGINIRQYDRCNEEMILQTVDHLFITRTRKELNFEQEPEDKVHYVELSERTVDQYNTIVEDEMLQLPECLLICDTKSKLRFSLHQLEGGTMKFEDLYMVLGNNEKVDYIKKHFRDRESLVIMYNYKAERVKLEHHFKKARILQATSYAEGIDLHKYKDLVIYSQDFSTARHTQRRARQANKKRREAIVVHYLLVKKGLSEQVYKTVSVNKKNYVDSVFTKEAL